MTTPVNVESQDTIATAVPSGVVERPLTSLGKIAEITEKVAKVSGILAIFGYMSLRAHVNYLGIPSGFALKAEQYLMELYSVMLTVWIPLAVRILLLASVFVVLRLLAQILGIWKFTESKYINGLKVIRRFLRTAFGSLIAMVVLLALFFIVSSAVSQVEQGGDVVIGKLCVEQLSPPDNGWAFYFLLFVCGSAFGLVSWVMKPRVGNNRTTLDLAARYGWILFFVVSCVVSLHLPIIYGCVLHPSDYPEVLVVLGSKDEPIRGLLVLEGESAIEVWSAENGIGKVAVIPRSEIRTTVYGKPQNILTIAKSAVTLTH